LGKRTASGGTGKRDTLYSSDPSRHTTYVRDTRITGSLSAAAQGPAMAAPALGVSWHVSPLCLRSEA
jgi:hypothetical protein